MVNTSELLPQNDFWRTCLLGAIVLLAFPLLVVLATEAPIALVSMVVVAFLAWVIDRTGIVDGANDEGADEPELDAVETLRKRYATGDIDEAEFERRLDTLLETEDEKPRESELAFE